MILQTSNAIDFLKLKVYTYFFYSAIKQDLDCIYSTVYIFLFTNCYFMGKNIYTFLDNIALKSVASYNLAKKKKVN